jgi:DNA mismatch endonuclease (patch repair protein)
VFTRQRIAVFVDGCFWHLCPVHGSIPKANTDWWKRKLERTQARDDETNQKLTAAGWEVIRIWEHEAVSTAADRIERVLCRADATKAASISP